VTSPQPTPEQVAAGHAFYSRRTLAVYDLAILGFFSRVAWRCSSQRVLSHYNRHVSANHIDIGVGTGFFLDRCIYPGGAPRIALLDANTACLDAARRRIARYGPETYETSVLEPLDLATDPFESIGMNYLLHCLPGSLDSKQVVFHHVRALASPGATVFGATLLSGGVHRNWLARQVMERNNRVGIFSNRSDDLEGLQDVLDRHLENPSLDVVGCVALFAGGIRSTER